MLQQGIAVPVYSNTDGACLKGLPNKMRGQTLAKVQTCQARRHQMQ